MDSTKELEEIRAELREAKENLTADLAKIDRALTALSPPPTAPARRGRPPGRPPRPIRTAA